MSHVFESKITALEGECERLRAELESWHKGDEVARLEARVKRYREALQYALNLFQDIQFTRDLMLEEVEIKGVFVAALAEPKADSEGA